LHLGLDVPAKPSLHPVVVRASDSKRTSITHVLGHCGHAVNAGASLGFLPELTVDASRTNWRSLLPELQAGSRVLLAAFSRGRLVGTAQLGFRPRLTRHTGLFIDLSGAPARRSGIREAG
jgi:hypothetical protein